MDNISRKQSLSAVPVLPGILEKHPLENGGIRVVAALPTRPLQRKLLRLPETTRREFELDAFGREILGWCDGINSVNDLLKRFSQKYPMHPQESEKAVLSFLRTLVAKGLVVLTIPERAPDLHSATRK